MAAGTEAVANLGARAESTAPAATVDNYFYQASILTLVACTIAAILMSAPAGRVLRSSYYTLAGMLWETVAALLGFFAKEPTDEDLWSEGDIFIGFEFQVPAPPALSLSLLAPQNKTGHNRCTSGERARPVNTESAVVAQKPRGASIVQLQPGL